MLGIRDTRNKDMRPGKCWLSSEAVSSCSQEMEVWNRVEEHAEEDQEGRKAAGVGPCARSQLLSISSTTETPRSPSLGCEQWGLYLRKYTWLPHPLSLLLNNNAVVQVICFILFLLTF